MEDKSYKKLKREWKKVNEVKELRSKKDIFLIIFWLGLFTYSILSLSLSVISLFHNSANTDVYMNGKVVAVDYWYPQLHEWVYTDENKVGKIIANTFMFLYIAYLYYLFITRRINTFSVYIFLGMVLINIAYRTFALPSYNKTTLSKDEIIQTFRGSHNINSPIDAVWNLKPNFMGWISMNNLVIRLLCIFVPITISTISFIFIVSSSGMDRIIMK